MAFTASVTVSCPYCAVAQPYLIEADTLGALRPDVYLCDPDVGGCDRYFVVLVSLFATARTSAIAGEVAEDPPCPDADHHSHFGCRTCGLEAA
jgi:hypothetical protein